jgi:queuine/archaeosine tRNA-ribosyltransferase
MKVLCIKALEHSGVQSYIRGKTYEITPEEWEALKKLESDSSFQVDNASDKPAGMESSEKAKEKTSTRRGRPSKDRKEE